MGRMRRRKRQNASKATASSPQPSSSMSENAESRAKKDNKSATKDSPQEVLTGADRHNLEQLVTDFAKSHLEDCKMPDLSKAQRAHVHHYAQRFGLKTRTHTKDGQRVLSIIRRETSKVLLCRAKSLLMVGTDLKEYLANSLPSLKRRLSQRDQGQSGALSKRVFNGYGLVSPALVPPPNRCFSSALWRERNELPISAHRPDIIRLLKQSQVLIINGATGSGKSTQLPQFILENATDESRPVRIVVCQPRRVAATTVAGRIAHERAEQLGHTVGYQIRMENKYSSKTALAFTTSGCLLRALVTDSEELFKQTTHLILDEVHERDLDTDFLLLATKIELKRNRHLKLILMSATMNLVDLSNYFGGVSVLNIKGRSFDVRIWHLEEILQITGYMTPIMKEELEATYDDVGDDDAVLDDDVIIEDGSVKKEISEFDDRQFEKQQLMDAYNKAHPVDNMEIDYDLVVSLLEMLLRIGQRGAVIVYLPGYHDMTILLDRIDQALPRQKIKTHVLHSQIDTVQQRDAFQIYGHIQLKIILSTNIGQTSITIPDLLYVIDLGMAKIKSYDQSTDTSQLTCSWISKADAQQRAGRAGRRQSGICYRLYSTERFQNMTEFVIPEMQRRTLDEICLLTKVAFPDYDVASFLSQALNPPQSDIVIQSCSRLKQLSILREVDEKITLLGKIIALLPLDVHMGKCLVYSIYFGCLGTMVIIAAFYSVRDPFVLNTDTSRKGQQQTIRRSFGLEILSDSMGIVKLYEAYMNAAKKGRTEAYKYCEENFVCRQSMDMFVSAVTNLRESVKRIFRLGSLPVSKYDNDFNMVRLALTAGLYPKVAYIDRTKKGTLVSENQPQLQFSRHSCLQSRYNRMNIISLPTDWIMFVEKSRWDAGMTTIEHTTLISCLMLALVAGKKIKLERNTANEMQDQQEIPSDQDEESHQEEEQPQQEYSTLFIDNWVQIILEKEFGEHLLQLRSILSEEFTEMLQCREMTRSMNFNGPDVIQTLLHMDLETTCLQFPGSDQS